MNKIFKISDAQDDIYQRISANAVERYINAMHADAQFTQEQCQELYKKTRMYCEDVLKKCTAFNELDIDAKQQALADWLAGDDLQYLDCTKTQNIVKSTCQELGITQKELAEQLDVSPASVSDWAKGNIPKMTKVALELMLENKSLKHKLQIFKEAHKIASEL